ncbi:MAG: OmpA family protein [Breznakibacter sp.]
MKPSKLYFLISFMLISTFTWAQKADLKKANNFLTKGEYFKAMEIYELAQKTGLKLDLEAKKKLARCYYELNKVEKAFNLYTEINETKELTGDDVFLYARTLHRFGFYSEEGGAIEYYQKSLKHGANPIVVNELIKGCQWAMENEIYMPGVVVNPSTLETYGQSFGVQYYKNGLVYSSALESKSGKNLDKQGLSFLNLYISDIDENGELKPGKRLFSENLVFDFHVGAISFTSDYNTMYLTRSVLAKGGRNVMKIFSVQFDGKQWGKPMELPINSNDYDCAMPAVSPDDKYLYFVSNKKADSYGGKDIFVAEIKRNNTFGEVKNLGPDVNTFGDEVFPVISKNNVLYFSSDGHYGFGGLDLFSSEFINGKWTNVKNMLKPYNSNYDDFCYVIDPNDKTRGFLSTNNFGSNESDVIFYVRPRTVEKDTKAADEERVVAGLEMLRTADSEKQPVVETKPGPEPQIVGLPNQLSSLLTSTFNGTSIGGATVVLKETVTGKVIGQAVSDDNGRFSISIPDEYRKEDLEFELEVFKGDEFKPKKMVLNIQEFEDLKKSGIALTPIFNDAVLDDIGGMVIPYVGNEITAEGYKILDRLAAYLLSNPSIVIKLNGHTDARGNRYINLTVSQQVAEKAEMYLKTKGVPDENMIPRGYAERYLINKCKRGKYCTEQEHLQNRRVEVVVWKRLNK